MWKANRFVVTTALLLCPIFSLAAGGQAVDIPNASFEEGITAPAEWTLSGGEGDLILDAADGDSAVTVTGTGGAGDSNYWRSDSLDLAPFTVYRLRFHAKRVDGKGGCPTSGPVFCNRDLTELTDEWAQYTSVFVTPTELAPAEAWLRFGQWEVRGTVVYDAVELLPAQPVYRQINGLVLGEGESVLGNQYTFQAPFRTASFNHARPLAVNRCYFNSHRWVFGAGREVVYRHRVGNFRQKAASAEVTIGHYAGGELVVEAGKDGKTWTAAGTLGDPPQADGTATFEIPKSLLPAKEVWVRFRARTAKELGQDSDPGSFQIYGYTYRATLDGDAGEARGTTHFVAVTQADPRFKVQLTSLGEGLPGGANVFTARVENTTDTAVDARPCLLLRAAAPAYAGGEPQYNVADANLEPGVTNIEVPYRIRGAGTIAAEITLGLHVNYRAETTFEVAHLFASGYGEVLPGSTDAVGLWWASSGWKISKTRPMPETPGKAVRIQAAKNEVEAAQLVVHPAQQLNDLFAHGDVLTGPGGATIPAYNVEVLTVRYVPVTQPTDKTGVAAPWPDPLPHFKWLLNLEAKTNQPVWVRVKVPRTAPAGLYTGVIHLTAENYAVDVPLEVEVFDFMLPDRMTCTTAFGFSAARAFQYHKVTEPEHKREVYDKYLAALSAHHISPYDPAALDPLKYTWPKLNNWPGGVRDETVKHGGQSSLLLADDSAKKSTNAAYEELITIPPKGLKLDFWYKTKDAGQPFIVTLLHHDANGQWMYGKNNDIRIEGSGQWQHFERAIDSFPEGAAACQFKLWAALYAEDDSTTGTVWYDDLKLADAESGEVLIQGDFEPLGAEDLAALKPAFDWADWDAAMDRAMNHYHFNGFRLPIPGMGGGTFHARYEPSLLGYGEDRPEYKAAFTAYCQTMRDHLRDKGWLDEAYVYWFDEPSPKDYAFVMNGFRKLEEAAPEIGRMLTEQVEPDLVGGPNIWCPLTPAFDPEIAKERRAAGDRFWWYVCTGPKEPYATLFIDHPGTELRVWLWQTWKRRISGILIWETNYWTSSAAYPDPDHPQNPYEDPMGWRSGYSTPAGTKSPWGNGDGRFIYPPEAAADGRPAEPVLDPPVDSIRFEMLRDGIEDYEYMVILEDLIERKMGRLSDADCRRFETLLEVPDDVSTDLTHFTKDPAPIERRREAVARAIEALSRP